MTTGALALGAAIRTGITTSTNTAFERKTKVKATTTQCRHQMAAYSLGTTRVRAHSAREVSGESYGARKMRPWLQLQRGGVALLPM